MTENECCNGVRLLAGREWMTTLTIKCITYCAQEWARQKTPETFVE